MVFAKEWSDLQRRTDCLGEPLQLNNLGQREYDQVINAARLRHIKSHGCALVGLVGFGFEFGESLHRFLLQCRGSARDCDLADALNVRHATI